MKPIVNVATVSINGRIAAGGQPSSAPPIQFAIGRTSMSHISILALWRYEA